MDQKVIPPQLYVIKITTLGLKIQNEKYLSTHLSYY
jgi:hypothetical protein